MIGQKFNYLSVEDEVTGDKYEMKYTTKIVYGNGVFLATNPENIAYGYSTDGINWSARLPDNYNFLIGKWAPLKNLYFLNGNFYNIIDDDYYISSDGKTWSEGTLTLLDETLTIKKVICGNNEYLGIFKR